MNNFPKVVGFVPAYNSEKFILKTLNSLSNQTYPNFEIIICDDASSDNTFEVCQSFAKDHLNFFVIRNESNVGWLANYEKLWGIAVDRSEYCFFSPHDDQLYPNFISEQIDILKQNPKAVLCIPGMNNSFQNGVSFQTKFLDPTEKNDPVDRIFSILERKEYWWAACHGICKSSAVKKTLPIKKLKFGEKEFFADMLWFLELAFLGEIVHSDNTLFTKNYDAKSVSGSWKYGKLNNLSLWISIWDCIQKSTLTSLEKKRINRKILDLIAKRIGQKMKIYRKK